MKLNRRNSEIFNVSFLDVICCGFGAMVLLVLLSKSDVVGGTPDIDKVGDLLENISAEKKRKTTTQKNHDRLLDQARDLNAQVREPDAPDHALGGLKQQLAERQAQAKILQIQIDALAQKKAVKKASDEAVKVGGIPVDSNYIIFIVDTSGSMKTLWPRVIRELENILDIHPKVKGFQIMSDNGGYLIKNYAGKWMPDTPDRRKLVLSLMKHWNSFSNSSPVEGLQRALTTYAKRTDKLAIYIFGDDYSGSSYDPVLDTISALNLDSKTGQPIARIHGIGFYQVQGSHANRFATLMREVARRNRGAFVAPGV